MGFTVDIKGNASHLDKTIKNVKTSLSAIGSVATTAVTSIAAIGAIGAAGIASFIVSSSKAAINIEMLTMQFETLLGGADAAGKRMEEIVNFAASTPFEIPELAATSKLLQTMGGTMLATGDGLRMVGDAAAIVGKPLEEIGLHIGRVFGAMTSGTSAGDSVSRLQELGLVTGDVKRELESLAAAQKKGTAEVMTSEKALAKLKGILSANEGAMERLASTTQGKLSNMKDNLSKLQVAFGTGFNNGLKDALDAANTYLPQLENKFKESGQIVGVAISKAVEGNTQQLAQVGNYIGEVIMAGIEAAVVVGFYKITDIGKDVLQTIGSDAATAMSLMTGGGGGNYTAEFSKPKSIAPVISRAINQVSQSETLSEMRKNNARLQDSIDMKDFGKTTKDATKAGIKEGIKEVWYSLETGAKFSN